MVILCYIIVVNNTQIHSLWSTYLFWKVLLTLWLKVHEVLSQDYGEMINTEQQFEN